jgi:hypothetical protein
MCIPYFIDGKQFSPHTQTRTLGVSRASSLFISEPNRERAVKAVSRLCHCRSALPAASGNLLCENENTYIIKAFDFEYGTATGVEHLQENKAQCTKVLRDGVIVIEREGKEFNMLGTPVVR